MDLSTLSTPELRQLKAEVEKQIALRAEEDRKKGREQILEIMRGVGLTVEDLIGKGIEKSAAPGKKRAPAPIQYQQGENSWSGRGRKPKWIEAHVASGKSLDDLRVKN